MNAPYMSAPVEMMEYCRVHRPELFSAVLPDGRNADPVEARAALNAATGLNIVPSDDFDLACSQWLNALKAGA